MQLSPLKLGLIILTSVIVGIAITVLSFFAWMLSDTTTSVTVGGSANEQTVPSITLEAVEPAYLGTSSMTWGERPHSDVALVLAEGNARIVGTAATDGLPVAGLRLRLVLNRKANSSWAVTDKDGRYEIPVPPGQYNITGFEFDRRVANTILTGTILHPKSNTFGSPDVVPMEISADRPGKGLDFEFTLPVVITEPVGEVPTTAPVVLRWKPYVGATAYRVQLNETPSRNHVGNVDQVFSWGARPTVTTNSLDLTAAGAKLKPGHYYSIQIEALNEKGEPISENATSYRRGQFNIADK